MKGQGVPTRGNGFNLPHKCCGMPCLWIFPPGINRRAIGTRHHGQIIQTLVPTLYLQRIDAQLKVLVQHGHEAQIPRIHQVGPPRVFFNFVKLTGTKFFLEEKPRIARVGFVQFKWTSCSVIYLKIQFVLPSAVVRTATLICAPLIHKIRNQATARIRHTHGSMNKGFELHLRHFMPNLLQFLKRNFSGHLRRVVQGFTLRAETDLRPYGTTRIHSE